MSTATYIAHNDESTIDCHLERKSLSDLIVRQIAHADPPKAVAIHGTWGTGKTSLMKQVYAALGGNYFEGGKNKGCEISKDGQKRTVKPVWFEAWQYQHEENILAALLKEIRDQLASHHNFLRNVQESAVPTMLSLLQSIDLSIEQFGFKFGVSGLGDRLVANEEAYKKKNYSTPLDSHTLKKLLEDAINKLIGLDFIFEKLKKNETAVMSPGLAVIFIDDLDRCEPAVAYKILETIKVYLNLKNCVFVLGMDIEEVERILAKQYQQQMKMDEMKGHARLYLEKICQDIFHLGLPDMSLRLKFFRKLLEGRIEKDHVEMALSLAKEYEFIPPIPRSIKIFVNVIITHLSNENIRAYVANDERIWKKLLVLCNLYAFHHDIYNLIYLYPEKQFYNSFFLEHCRNPVEFKSKKGEFLLFQEMVFHEGLTATEAMTGSEKKEQEKDNLAIHFPHRSLRKVFWCRRMAVDAADFTDKDLKSLKLNTLD